MPSTRWARSPGSCRMRSDTSVRASMRMYCRFSFMYWRAKASASSNVPVSTPMTSLKKGAHLLIGHGQHIGGECVGDIRLAMEEGGESIDTHVAFVLRHACPLLAVFTEIDILGAPLLTLPAIIEFAIGGQVYQPFINDMQDVVDGGLLQLHQ